MTSPRDDVIGLPTFAVSSWESSSLFCFTRAANFESVRPRLPAAQAAQPLRSSNAFWAAATARSTSSLPPSGARAMTLPVAGLTTSKVAPSAASTCSPPMTIRTVVGSAVSGPDARSWVVMRKSSCVLVHRGSAAGSLAGIIRRAGREELSFEGVPQRPYASRRRPATIATNSGPDTPMRWSAWRASSKATSASGSDSRPAPFDRNSWISVRPRALAAIINFGLSWRARSVASLAVSGSPTETMRTRARSSPARLRMCAFAASPKIVAAPRRAISSSRRLSRSTTTHRNQIDRSSSSSRHESRNYRQGHPGGPPST